MARVLAIAPDLFFASKVEATLKAAGHEVTVVQGVEASSTADPDLVIVDLDHTADFGLGLRPGKPSLGFYSHTDVDTRRAAEQAGFDLVVPRSRMAREMPELVAGLLER